MWEKLLNGARWVRREFYEVSSAKVFGLEIDNILHFMVGAVLFAIVSRKWGTRTACWTLGACILLKEIVDVFAKSRVEYIQMPSSTEAGDIVWDVAASFLGGLAAWWWRRWKDN